MVSLLALMLIILLLFKGASKVMGVLIPIILGTMVIIGIENLLKSVTKAFFPVLDVLGVIAFIATIFMGIFFIFKKVQSETFLKCLITFPLVSLLAASTVDASRPWVLMLIIALVFSGIWTDSALILANHPFGQKLSGSMRLRALTAGTQFLILVVVFIVAMILGSR